jgi:hypothetical protein
MVILLIQDEDIEAAVETLKRYYEDIAKPYFDKYQTLAIIDDIINNPPFDYCPAHVGGNFHVHPGSSLHGYVRERDPGVGSLMLFNFNYARQIPTRSTSKQHLLCYLHLL